MLYDYRLLKISYQNYSQYDDGPGSFRHVASRSCKRVIETWESKDEAFGKELLNDPDYGVYVEGYDPWDAMEYSYRIEKREVGSDEWRFHGHPMELEEE